MGCAQSIIENDETVMRCKERKQFMKEAVFARNAFAAAHSAYAMALRYTGAGLNDYAHGEVPHPSLASTSLSGAALSDNGGGEVPYPSLASTSLSGGASALPQSPGDPLPSSPPPLLRAASMPEISFPKPDLKHPGVIIAEANEDDLDSESTHGLKHRRSRSSGGGVGNRSGISHREAVQEEELPKPRSPPPPRTRPQSNRELPAPPAPPPGGMASWEYFFQSMENVPGPTLAEEDKNGLEMEEFERKVLEERTQRSEIDSKAGGGSGDGGTSSSGAGRSGGGKEELAEVVEKPPELPSQLPQSPARVKRVKQVVPAEGRRTGNSSVNLLKIFNELDDCFLKASESVREVSKMLEAARLHYHSNFADNRGHMDHSAKVMRVITWNRSLRGLPNVDDGKDDFDSEEHETHATVLDKMLAWEKTLYDEVKAGKQMKLEYQRKVTALNKLKNHGSNTEALERMKAAVSHLHTRYIVEMQSMDLTVSEINRLRDQQLYPKLVALVDAMATMWESMRKEHKNQSKIVEALRSLDISQSSKETSDPHHDRTLQLWFIVSEWHSQFYKLIIHQKEYIKSLNSWLKLNLIPMDTILKEKTSSPQRPQTPPICWLLQAWHDYLEKLPDEVARTAIDNFASVVNIITQYQMEEIKLREKCEDTRMEVAKRIRQFEDWYAKYMQRRAPPDEMDPQWCEDKDLIAERQLQVDAIEHRLREEMLEYRRQGIQVREKSLTSLKTCLLELFLSMSDFSLASVDMYKDLRSISQQHTTRNGS